VWKYALLDEAKEDTDASLLDTILVAKKYENFSCIENLIQEFLKENPFEHNTGISLGCGAAKDLSRLKELFPSSLLFGIDTSREVLSASKKRLENTCISLICASISNLPFKKTIKFDMLVADQSIDLDFEDNYLKRLLKEITAFSAPKSRFYMTFYGTSDTQLELYKCTPIGNLLDRLGWKTYYGTKYRTRKRGFFAQGVFWVEERACSQGEESPNGYYSSIFFKTSQRMKGQKSS
jgi:hypothetical protein